ncbi:MAG: tape measure protein [Pigmentiphaga sp.]|nr:tape measure protein [Pigmentiphaga sp.]
MTTEAAALGLSVDSGDVVSATGDLEKFSASADRAGKASDRFEKEATDAGRGAKVLGQETEKAGRGMRALARVAGTVTGALVAAFSVRALIQYADAWSDMQSRIGAAVKDMAAAPELMGRMVDLANASYSPLGQTVEVYARNVAVLRDLGKTAMETADFTEALNHALVITATRGERAASVQNALSKAMAVGKLTGDGLETVMANGGRVAEALAEKLGTNVNGLRAMASQGKITSAVIAGALLDSLEKLRAEAGEMPATVDDGMTRIATGMQYLIGVLDQTTGASGSLAGALVMVGDALASAAKWASENGDTIQFVFDSVIGTAIAGVTALAVRFAATWAVSMYTSVTATGAFSASLVKLRAALTAAGIGAVVVAAGVLTGQFLRLVSAAGGFGAALKLVADVGREAIDRLELGWQGMGRIVSSVAAGLRATFASAFAFILQKFADMTQSVADGINDMFAPLGLNLGLSGIGGDAAASLSAFAEEESLVAKLQAAAAKTFFAGMTAPMESIKALNDVLSTTTDEVEGIGAAAAPTGEALAEMGGKGRKAAEDTKDGMMTLKSATEDFRNTLSQAFSGLVTGAMSLRNAVGNIISKLAEMAAMRGFEALWSGGMGQGVSGFLGKFLGLNADGNVFSGGRVAAFANGGVVSSTTAFPMQGGVGIMGEAGPEAIMPLKRGADGKLGVEAQGNGRDPMELNITLGVSVDESGNITPFVERVSGNVAVQTMRAANAQLARALPGEIKRVLSDPRASRPHIGS